MRLSLKRKRSMVVMVPAERMLDHLVWQRDGFRRHMSDHDAKGLLDALLRQQRRSRGERSKWLAFLFDQAQDHPAPFDLMAELANGDTTDAGPDEPPRGEGPDDAPDDRRSDSGVPRRHPIPLAPAQPKRLRQLNHRMTFIDAD
jgi:hypothetical protein